MTDKTDPAEKVKGTLEKEKLLSDMKTLDINNLTLADFKVVPRSRARVSHPFEGYPLAAEVEIGRKPNKNKVMASATYVVGLSPHSTPTEDVSGRGITVIDTKKKTERIVNLGTYHSRVLPTGPNSNEDVVFDRKMVLGDGAEIFFALVKNHSTRAQLLFIFNPKTQKIEVDTRYLLLDSNQNSRLQTLFQQIINPKLRRERMSQAVAGEIDTDEKTLQQLPTE